MAYTLIEMGLVLSLLAMIATYSYPALQRRLETRAVQNTAEGVGSIARLGLRYHSLEERWPGNLEEMLQRFSLNDHFRNRNGFGYQYQIGRGAAGHLTVYTRTETEEQALSLHRLTRPLSSVRGTSVSVSFPAPGSESGHDGLLPRDGSRPMQGDLDLGANDLHNVRRLRSTDGRSIGIGTAEGSATLGAGLIYADTIYARRFFYR